MSTTDLAILLSNLALVISTVMAALVDWHRNNTLVRVIQVFRPSWARVAKCEKCKAHHAKKHHGK